ncbi:MAG TPA: hypothetical protein VK860_07915 [Ilumatobacteraceae bacterium]|nr:hypothetical protein [Ilumatobacteraceae bacterium]
MNLSRPLAAVALSVAAALVTLPATSPATAQTVIDVAQGQTVSLGLVPFGSWSGAEVTPPDAGSLSFVENVGSEALFDELRFTASASFTGTVTIRQGDPNGVPIFLNVVGPSGDIAATFTPRPRPGPCITLSGTAVDFGDVEVGATVTSELGSETLVATCTTIEQVIAVQISDATAGAVTWEPTKGELSPNTFRWSVSRIDSVDDDNFPVDNEPTLFSIFIPGAFDDDFGVRHKLTTARGSTTGLGEQFSATLTFTAMEPMED